MSIKEHLSLLGFPVKDKVTGLSGVATSVSFDLYGCIQAIVNPGLDKDGKTKESVWFDVARLEKTGGGRVMSPPDFEFGPQAQGLQGPAEKPRTMKS